MTATTDHKVMNNRLDQTISARVIQPNTEGTDEAPEMAHIVSWSPRIRWTPSKWSRRFRTGFGALGARLPSRRPVRSTQVDRVTLAKSGDRRSTRHPLV